MALSAFSKKILLDFYWECANFRPTARCFEFHLKGQCREIFCVRFFSWITFPQARDNNIRIISNFFENSRRYSQVMVHHRWQIAAGINDTGGKFASGVNDTGSKFGHQSPLCCWHRWQICRRCQRRRWQIIGAISGCRHLKVNLKAKIYIYVIYIWISPRIFEKIRNGLNGIHWGWGETDSWKEPAAKNLVTELSLEQYNIFSLDIHFLL